MMTTSDTVNSKQMVVSRMWQCEITGSVLMYITTSRFSDTEIIKR